MKIVFIGTVEFSLKALELLATLDVDIVGVCTKSSSNFNADFVDLAPFCEKSKIPYIYTEDINSDETINWIKTLYPDIVFCLGWSSLIKKELLYLAPMGVIGYHPTELPLNRGRHPLIWAIALGLRESASSFFYMDEGADSGKIISQSKFEIRYEDDAKTLYERVTKLALKQIKSFVKDLKNGNLKTIEQEHNKANYWRKRNKFDGQIDFRMSSFAIYNLTRALSKPYVGAHIVYKEEEIKIWKVEELKFEANNIEPGKVIDVKDQIITVKCYDGAIRILEHEFDKLPLEGEYI